MVNSGLREPYGSFVGAGPFCALLEPVGGIFLAFFAPIVKILLWLSDKLLFSMLGKTYVYNVSWEVKKKDGDALSVFLTCCPFQDPRVERQVLHLKEKDHVLTIASALDNVLDYIIDGAKVTAVDLNPCQIALCELKVACIKEMDHAQFFSVFAENKCDLVREFYQPKLRRHLSSPSQEFWDSRVSSIQSFMYSGASGALAFVIFRILFPLFGFGWVRKACEKGERVEVFQTQCLRYKKRLRILAWLADHVLLYFGSALAGVPQKQLRLGHERGNTFGVVLDNILFRTDLCRDNYFFAGYILGGYKDFNCPRYLRPEHFDSQKEALKEGRLRLKCTTIEALLREEGEKGPRYTVASLLDHLDWLDHATINEELSQLLPRMDPRDARVFWRSYSNDVHSPILAWLKPEPVDMYPENDVLKADRVGMYFSSWLAQAPSSSKKKKKAQLSISLDDSCAQYDSLVLSPRCRAWGDASGLSSTPSFLSQLRTGAQIVTFPIRKKLSNAISLVRRRRRSADARAPSSAPSKAGDHASQMEAFYAAQAEGYDSFRENFLHARQPLIACCPLKEGGDMVWVDIGGGTARNLEFFTPEVLKKTFKAIYIVDISPSLLAVAAKRLQKVGLENLVRLVAADFTNSSETEDKLPADGTVDLVTFSYSLSMIPGKTAALERAVALLKPKGEGCLGVADFWATSGREASLPPLLKRLRRVESFLHRAWFKQDGVHLLSEEMMQTVTERLESPQDAEKEEKAEAVAASGLSVYGSTLPKPKSTGLERQLNLLWQERFRGSVPLLPFLQPYHGFFIAVTK